MDLHYFSLVWVLYLIASMSANKVELAVPELPENNMVTGGTDLHTREIEKRVWDTYYNLSMIGSSEPNWGIVKETPREELPEFANSQLFEAAGHYNKTGGAFNERRRVSSKDLYFCERASGCGVDDSYYQSLNWMGKIRDSTKLHLLSIPGTHDSGALYAGSGGKYTRAVVVCQSMRIAQQLRQGVRAFDIRNRHINNVFAIHHDKVFQNAFFGDIVRTMTQFLNENPSETIIIRHQREHTNEKNTRTYDQTMDWYVRTYPKLVKINSGSSALDYTLGDARGKILIDYFSRMEKDVQDDYKITSCKRRDEKARKISALIDKARRNRSDRKLYVNFVSANGYGATYNPFSGCFPGLSISGMAKFLNEKLGTKLGRISGDNPPRIGIIFMDFPGPRLISHIIKQNPFFCKRLQTAYVNSIKVVTRCETRVPLRSGDTIALRSMCATKGWVSNWCTKNCGEITRPRTCPGTNFGRHEIKRCGGEALIIVAEGRRRGESIRSGDVIGLYYGGGYWMSCEGYKKNCKTRPCPGPISNYKNSGWRWDTRCHWEMFRIKFSWKVHNGALLYNGDEVVIQREIPGRSGCSSPSNWYLSEEGRRITLRDCPGCNNGNIKQRCRCEAFQLTTFGSYYSMG